MDFATRDHYRHVVETTARHSRRTEGEVAHLAVGLAAQAAATAGPDARAAHVGFYLVSRGTRGARTRGARAVLRYSRTRGGCASGTR